MLVPPSSRSATTLAPRTSSPPDRGSTRRTSGRRWCSRRCRWKALAGRRFRRSAARSRGTASRCSITQSGHSVGGAALMQVLESRNLLGGGGNHQLAAFLEWNRLLLAEAFHRGCSGNAIARLQGPGLVVEAGMNHAAVVAGLMGGHAGLLVHDDETHLREAAGDFQGGCQPHNSSADDEQVRSAVRHISSPAKPAIIRRAGPRRHDARHARKAVSVSSAGSRGQSAERRLESQI